MRSRPINSTAATGGNIYCTYGCAVVFELSPGSDGWTETVLHRFCTRSGCEDGGGAIAGPTMGAAGELYGTAGVVYDLTPAPDGWQYLVLYDFNGNNGDGLDPYAGVILDAAGNLYGTTENGASIAAVRAAVRCTSYRRPPQAAGARPSSTALTTMGRTGTSRMGTALYG